MRFRIEELEVLFPYDHIYPEQYLYMVELKKALDAGGHGLLEMPSGTGKTITLLALLMAYQRLYPERLKQIIYCTRTVPEIDKALAELKRLVSYHHAMAGSDTKGSKFLGIGLASRKNLCVNDTVMGQGADPESWTFGRTVDSRCQSLTASWVRARGGSELCEYYENLAAGQSAIDNLDGVFTLDELREHGKASKICPYFLARQAIAHANVIIYSYYYLLDPKVAGLVSRELPRESVVIFDEAHNIDNVCIESLSIDLTRSNIEAACRSLRKLEVRIESIRASDEEKLKEEYEKLVKGLKRAEAERAEDRTMASPVLPDDLLAEAIPGSIRQAGHFVRFMMRLTEFLRSRFKNTDHVLSESPQAFLSTLRQATLIDRKPLRFCSERLASLAKTLELAGPEWDMAALDRVAAFATLVSTYVTGFTVLFEPFDEAASGTGSSSALLSLACLDATIAIKPVFARFRSVIITSGTLSPLDMFPRLLDFAPAIQASLPMTLVREGAVSPLIVTRGADQVAVSSRFEIRNDPAVVRNYGLLLLDFCKIVPDGIVCFFPSYTYLESIVSLWQEMGIVEQLLKLRLLFIETPDGPETAIALANYRRACDTGRGAVLLSVARGKVSEGIDFDGHYGRAVLMLGIPYQYTESRILKARLEYMRAMYQVRETDFLTFDALRHAAQCLGRVLRGKSDYGLMVLADKRYARGEKRNKLPLWIKQAIREGNANLSSDQAAVLAKRFYREMAQPVDLGSSIGYALLREEDVVKLEEERTAHATGRGYL